VPGVFFWKKAGHGKTETLKLFFRRPGKGKKKGQNPDGSALSTQGGFKIFYLCAAICKCKKRARLTIFLKKLYLFKNQLVRLG
jgi:hypothetical protein